MGVKKLELFRTLLQTTCVIFVVGCGGGGGTSPAVGLQPLNPTPPPSPTYPHTMPGSDIGYNTEPDVGITDAVAQLDIDYCTLSNIQHTITLDLNNDSQLDILMFVLCGDPDIDWPGDQVEHDLPFRNTMLALVSQPGGGYAVDNQSLFGKNDMELGAQFGGVAGFFTPLENPNGGLPLISYIISRDDFQRKLRSDYSNMVSQQGILVPNFEGKYELKELADPIWAQGVIGIPNMNYTWDILYAYWDADWRVDQPIAFRQSGEDFVDVSDEYYDDSAKYSMGQHDYIQALDSFNLSPFGTTKSINIDYAVGGDGDGITLYQLNGGAPTKLDFWNVYDNKEWIEWGAGEEQWCGRREIVFHNDRPYFGGFAWDHFEVWYPTPDSQPVLLAMAAVKTLPYGEEYDANATYDCDTEFYEATLMTMFEFNSGRLEWVESPFDTDLTPGGGVLKQAIDVNGDGYMDWFTANGWGHDTLPLLWLNDQNGKLIQTNTDDLPSIAGYTICDQNNVCLELEADGFFADMNGDGVMDVIQWHTGTVVPTLHDWMYEAGVNASAFENKSGFINIWYGNEE